MRVNITYIIVAVLIGTLSACGDMYTIHQKYLDKGEKTYIGISEVVDVQGGNGRIKLSWKLNVDPRIKECRIYWNERQDSIAMKPDYSSEVMSKTLKLDEGQYLFELVNFDDEGNSSIAQVASGRSYGSQFSSTLMNRIKTEEASLLTGYTSTWSLENRCERMVMTYDSKDGTQKTVELSGEDMVLQLPDIQLGGAYEIISYYWPEEGALETIPCLPKQGKFPTFISLTLWEWLTVTRTHLRLDRSAWVASASSEELTGEGASNGRVIDMLDDDAHTFWHSKWRDGFEPMPYILTFDMLEEQKINTIYIARRSNNRDLKRANIEISSDGNTWKELGYVEFSDQPSDMPKAIYLDSAVQARYLRVNVVSSNNGQNASIATLWVTTAIEEEEQNTNQ